MTTGLSEAASFFAQFAQLAEQREKDLGHPLENCPTAEDLWNLAAIVESASIISKTASVVEVNQIMQSLVAISDKWVDPESDPIGSQIFEPTEEIISKLQQLIGEAMPEAAQSLKDWNALRRVEQALRRRLYLRRKIKPKFLAYLIGKWEDWQIRLAFRKQN